MSYFDKLQYGGDSDNEELTNNNSDDDDIVGGGGTDDDDIVGGGGTDDDDIVDDDIDDDIDDDDIVDDDDEYDDDDDDKIGGGADEYDDDDDDLENNPSQNNNKVNNTILQDDDDDDDDDDNDYLNKFDNEINQNYLLNFHPECAIQNYDEILALSKVIRDKNNIIIDGLHKTIPLLTKYERTRVLGQRTKQLNSGAFPYVKVGENVIDSYLIAQLELQEKRIPFIIRRPIPNGGSEFWCVKDLENVAF